MRQPDDWCETDCTIIQQNDIINEQQLEIAELKSMVDILQRAARQTDNQFRIHAKLDTDTKTILSCALAKTRNQSLQSVKADAVKEAAFKLADGLLISPSAQREMMEYAQELDNG